MIYRNTMFYGSKCGSILDVGYPKVGHYYMPIHKKNLHHTILLHRVALFFIAFDIIVLMEKITFNLTPVPPFRLDLTAWVLRRRPDNVIDRWDGHAYSRVLAPDGVPFEVTVKQGGMPERLVLNVAITGRDPDAATTSVVAALERLIGIRRDLSKFYDMAMQDGRLGPLVKRFYGLKPPRFDSVFEALVNAFACQQLTLTVGIKLLNRLTIACGKTVQDRETVGRAFPRPEDILRLDSEELKMMGFSRQKTSYITGLAREVVEGRLDLENMDGMDDETVLERLRSIKGVGRWSAEYALLRGLGRVHVYPGDDVGARNKLQRWLNLKEQPNYEMIKKHLSPWKPYQGLIYFHLLLDSLEREGYLNMEPQWVY